MLSDTKIIEPGLRAVQETVLTFQAVLYWIDPQRNPEPVDMNALMKTYIEAGKAKQHSILIGLNSTSNPITYL